MEIQSYRTPITNTKSVILILSNIAMQQDLISSKTFLEKDSYAHYLSYATLMGYIANVRAFISVFWC